MPHTRSLNIQIVKLAEDPVKHYVLRAGLIHSEFANDHACSRKTTILTLKHIIVEMRSSMMLSTQLWRHQK